MAANTELLRSRVALWFRYLKVAQRLGLPVDWNHYKEWGTPEEISASVFAPWWKTKGHQLFERRELRLVVTQDGDKLIVAIPVTFTVRELRKELGPAVSPYLSKSARVSRGKYRTTGLVRYDEMKRYLQLLEIELRSQPGRPMREKLEELAAKIDRDRARIEKQNLTIRSKAGGKKRVRRFKPPRTASREVRLGYLWLKKARRIAGNTAAGTFPGREYYHGKP